MEGVRDAALADYENLPDEEKAKIQNDFNQLIAKGSSTISDYIEFFQEVLPLPQIVDKLLQNCEGYEEGRLDFKDFITVKYVLEKHYVVTCDGCLSLILGRTYFSCYECFFDFPLDSYDLCSGCYRSKKFEDHSHEQFYDNKKLLSLSREVVAAEKEEKQEIIALTGRKEDLETRINQINGATIEFAGKCLDFARSITTDGSENFSDSVLNFDNNKELGWDWTQPEEEEEEANSAMASRRPESQEVHPHIDILGVNPTPQALH